MTGQVTHILQCSQHKHKNSQAKHDSLWLVITVAGETEAGGFLGFTGQWMSSRFSERFAFKKMSWTGIMKNICLWLPNFPFMYKCILLHDGMWPGCGSQFPFLNCFDQNVQSQLQKGNGNIIVSYAFLSCHQQKKKKKVSTNRKQMLHSNGVWFPKKQMQSWCFPPSVRVS